MKKTLFLLIVTLFVSCINQDEKTELEPIASSSFTLNYPSNIGTSGDSINGLLGYGYDASGFCDTISVKAKIFDSLPVSRLYFGHPSTTFPTLINGADFNELLSKLNYANGYSGSVEALTQHLKSLIKLANNSDSIESGYAYTYYAITSIATHKALFTSKEDYTYLTTEFKNDVNSLTPKEIVSKYGTHVLTDLFSGAKFEVLYRCKFKNTTGGDVCENLFYNRMKEFAGGTQYIYKVIDSNTKLYQTNEELIYNSIGLKNKMCGVINVTDYNPNGVYLNMSELFTKDNYKSQFNEIGADGIFPIYEFITDATKSQEVKTYIDEYLSPFSSK